MALELLARFTSALGLSRGGMSLCSRGPAGLRMRHRRQGDGPARLSFLLSRNSLVEPVSLTWDRSRHVSLLYLPFTLPGVMIPPCICQLFDCKTVPEAGREGPASGLFGGSQSSPPPEGWGLGAGAGGATAWGTDSPLLLPAALAFILSLGFLFPRNTKT